MWACRYGITLVFLQQDKRSASDIILYLIKILVDLETQRDVNNKINQNNFNFN